MRRLGPAAAVLLVVAVGCEASAPRTRPPSSTASPRPPGSPTASAPRVLPEIVLRADLGEGPARWDLVARLPFGKDEDELGLQLPPEHTPLPIFPVTFAVASDRSIWVGDVFKRRAAHFSQQGRYLGSVRGIKFNRFTPYLVDMAFAGETLLLMLRTHVSLKAKVMPVVNGNLPPRTILLFHGKPVVAQYLIPTSGERIVRVEGFSGRPHLGTGPSGFARVEVPGSGKLTFLPGVPLQDGTFVDVRLGPETSQNVEVRFTKGGHVTIQPIRVELWTGRGPDARRIPAGFSIEPTAPLPNGIAVLLTIGPTRTKDAHVGGGRWVLGVSDDGSPLIWERLREPGLSDENTVRTITSTPDGGLYLMVPERGGMAVYRR